MPEEVVDRESASSYGSSTGDHVQALAASVVVGAQTPQLALGDRLVGRDDEAPSAVEALAVLGGFGADAAVPVEQDVRFVLDIEQEVSNVVRTTTSGIDSPTIQQRKVATRVVVNDGEAIALGGLIQERETATRGQVPILGEVPVFGNLFRNKTSRTERTELIIFIRPRIIRNVAEARAVTDEFRRKLDFHQPSFQEKAAKELKRLQ